MTDGYGRTGLEYETAANHDKNTDWNVVEDCYLEITTTSGREMVNFGDQAGTLPGQHLEEWRPDHFHSVILSGQWIDYIAFEQDRP